MNIPTTPTVSLTEAAQLLGIGRSTAYAAAHNDEFPVQVIKVGGRYIVPTKPLLDLLGIEEVSA